MNQNFKNNNIPDFNLNDDIPLPILNQGNIPACVAHAIVSMMQTHWYGKTGKIIPFSSRFLDILSWTDDLEVSDGRDPELVMKLACDVGCCTEALLPNDTALPIERYRDKSLITKEMLEEAAKYRLSDLNLRPYKIF